jgi:putative acetyltransferase
VINVRRQTPEDDVAVRNVNEQAFDLPAEANLVEAIRNRGADTLSLVAVQDATVVGHILFSPVDIVSARTKLDGVALGPMPVCAGALGIVIPQRPGKSNIAGHATTLSPLESEWYHKPILSMPRPEPAT